jgi:hypothetical protein
VLADRVERLRSAFEVNIKFAVEKRFELFGEFRVVPLVECSQRERQQIVALAEAFRVECGFYPSSNSGEDPALSRPVPIGVEILKELAGNHFSAKLVDEFVAISPNEVNPGHQSAVVLVGGFGPKQVVDKFMKVSDLVVVADVERQVHEPDRVDGSELGFTNTVSIEGND